MGTFREESVEIGELLALLQKRLGASELTVKSIRPDDEIFVTGVVGRLQDTAKLCINAADLISNSLQGRPKLMADENIDGFLQNRAAKRARLGEIKNMGAKSNTALIKE